jgi:hypothetical protein
MATWDDVRRIALSLPETSEGTGQGNVVRWAVRNQGKEKGFVWERPLRKGDLAALGLTEQPGPVIAARVPDIGVKDALIADDPAVFFTTPHFNGYPAILAHLDAITVGDLTELITEAWLAQAPKPLAARYLGSR